MVKLSQESNWYHMYLEDFRTLHAFEIGEMCHTWLCDLVIMCIGEIWWFMWLVNNVNLYGDVYMMTFVIFDDAWTLDEFNCWWLPCLYFWNDELCCWVD